ncbi:hypothetical protein TruAng_007495 [Truncatella angustata]|nr:hypothetical protein TruAng_007495 [Truncatella angustata]
MRSLFTVIPSLVVVAGAARTSTTLAVCPPIEGDITVNVPNIYPEGADFALSSCKFYIGSLNNGSLVEWDPYTSVANIIELPGVGHNSDYFVCGVDYSHATGTIYVAVSARAPWYPSIGGNLTGPNRLIHYSPLEKSILWQADVDALVKEIEQETGSPIAGFQETAEDMDGNAYFIAAFSNVILKVDKDGQATKFYAPEKPDRAYGFGGAFVTQENVLVLGDALSHAFVRFDLSGPTPTSPTFTAPQGHPDTYEGILECDALIAPPRFHDKVALCSSVLNRNYSPHGAITVYTSEDGWKTSKFAGVVPVEFGQSPDVWSTAQLASSDKVYALSSALPYDGGSFPQTHSTTLVDITAHVDDLVRHLVPSAEPLEDASKHEEL